MLRPELCRALLKRSLVSDREGDQTAAKADRAECMSVYLELGPHTGTAPVAITEDAADDLVAFWSR